MPDLVLADRIRSSLGPLEKRLDLPRVHVMVKDHVTLLHSDVGAQKDADDIRTAVADDAVAETLTLPHGHEPRYLLPVGCPRPGT